MSTVSFSVQRENNPRSRQKRTIWARAAVCSLSASCSTKRRSTDAGLLCQDLRHHVVDVDAFGDGLAVAPVGAEHVILGLQG